MTNFVVKHFLVAVVWVFLSGQATFGGFLLALVWTFLLLILFQKPLGCESYVKRVNALLLFIFGFVVDVVRSNFRILRIALRPDAKSFEGRFIRYDVRGLTNLEILLISQCIGLSPGTMVADRIEEGELIVHVFGGGSDEELVAMLDRSLKFRILAFTR